jgi:hypothetical protein
MQDYSAQIAPRDRWRIIAYIRVLQLSGHATMNDVPPDVRQHLENEPITPALRPAAAGGHSE